MPVMLSAVQYLAVFGALLGAYLVGEGLRTLLVWRATPVPRYLPDGSRAE